MARMSIVIVTWFAIGGPLAAQSDTTGGPPRHLCWRGEPAPACTTFWITEFGIDASMASTQSVISESYGGTEVSHYTIRDFDSRLIWTVGPMFNDKPRRAVGATFSVSPLNSHYRAAVEARRRWWSSDDLAFDLSAGAVRMGIPPATGGPYRPAYGLTAGAFMSGGDLIVVNGRVDLLLTGRRPRAGTSVGLAGGSYIALASTLVLGALILAVISAGPWD
jgi:hypothetical protein